jgi:hypothetical protein
MSGYGKMIGVKMDYESDRTLSSPHPDFMSLGCFSRERN